MCLHFSGKWIISIIDIIADIVHQTLAKITCSREAMVYHWKTSIDWGYGFRTPLPTEIRKQVPRLFAKHRFTCPTNVREVSSMVPSCLIDILTIHLGVQVSICRDWNCGSYSPDILLWHMTNGNERHIIDWENQPDIHCPHHDGRRPFSVGLKSRPLHDPAEFVPGGVAQLKSDTTVIDHMVNTACSDVLRLLDGNFRSSSPEVQAKIIHNIRSVIRRRILATGKEPAMAKPRNNQGTLYDDFLDYVLEELIQQPDDSFNRLSSFVAATDASIQFSAILPIGGSTIASSS